MKRMKTVRAWVRLWVADERPVTDVDWLPVLFATKKEAACSRAAAGLHCEYHRIAQIEIREVTPATRKRASKRAKGRR